MADLSRAISGHYGRSSLLDALRAGLQAAGLGSGTLTPDQLAAADQFHTGGIVATRRLIELSGVRPEWRVLDVGGGLGGPARTLAQEIGCQVTVMDLTHEYVEAGAWLTERTGQGDRVTHQVGD